MEEDANSIIISLFGNIIKKLKKQKGIEIGLKLIQRVRIYEEMNTIDFRLTKELNVAVEINSKGEIVRAVVYNLYILCLLGEASLTIY